MKTTTKLFTEEREAMKTFFQLREELSSVNEDKEHYFGYEAPSGKAADKGIKALHKSGLKVNHGDQGSTPGSKPHKNPDATVHYEIGDEPHRDGASGVTLHSRAAKTHGAATHFQKAQDHADNEEH